MKRTLFAAMIAMVMASLAFSGVAAAKEKEFNIAWSHYTGWEPWEYADKAGVLKKWGDKYGIKIKVTLINDYIESINLYTAGKYDGCTMTNMDALTIPAVGGIDSTALVIGDFSNGNDGIVMKNGEKIEDLKGRDVKLVELSVSHYLLTRALTMKGMKERDLKLVNTSDADIGGLFMADKNAAVVTWNPILMKIAADKGAKVVFDSSKIPGEIIDMLVVRSNAPDSLKKALVGAWFETMKIMSESGKEADRALSIMARSAGSSVEDFKKQLQTTAMFYKAQEAVDFTKGADIKKTMEYVRTFSYDHGLFGEGASSKDIVGIWFPDGTVMGKKQNVKLRFDASYMDMMAKGALTAKKSGDKK